VRHSSSRSRRRIRFRSSAGSFSGSLIEGGLPRVRGGVRRPQAIPATARWLICHTRSGGIPSLFAASVFGVTPSQTSRIVAHSAWARRRSSSLAASHSARIG
jgi:hypothetical protein